MVELVDDIRRDSTVVIFLHIPKTAGLTLYDVLNREYKRSEIYTFEAGRQRLKHSIEQFKRLPTVERANLRLLRGHAPFGMHKFISQPYTYVTILRDPIARVISHYHYVKRNPSHTLHDMVISKEMDLATYVASGINYELDNGQVRLLAGVDDEIEFGGCSRDHFNQAMQHIESRFSIVGLMERFDESLLLMKKILKWRKFPLYTRQNVSNHKLGPQTISTATRQVIEKYNTFDCEVYEYAQKQFKERVALLSEPDLKLFNLLNSVYYPYGKTYSIARSTFKTIRSLLNRT